MNTTTEIITVRSLRELDALAAEKLFEWRWLPWFGNTEQLILVPDESYFHSSEIWGRNILHFVPKYSTDIASAWLIVDKFDNPHTSVVIETYSDGWCCRIIKSSPEIFQSLAKTAPIAICLAALKTVGAEVKLELNHE